VAAIVAELAAVDLDHAPPPALVALLAACAGAEGRIAARLAIAGAEAPAPALAGPETFISVKEAAARLGVSPKWLYRRKKTLPFMRGVGPGTWRVSVPALERWMARRGRT
jgi:excisionase family DNA binding protein